MTKAAATAMGITVFCGCEGFARMRVGSQLASNIYDVPPAGG